MLLTADAYDWLLIRSGDGAQRTSGVCFPAAGLAKHLAAIFPVTGKALAQGAHSAYAEILAIERVLSNGSAVYGRNRAGHGVRGVYLEGDGIEPELQHLENFLDSDAVFVDVGQTPAYFLSRPPSTLVTRAR